jgi:Predicted ATPase (AAA+ superfamily)
MKENIIGREQEIGKLENYISSRKSEFIAIYGRRRVGKTFLVKELFENRFTFRITGKDNVTTKEQLASFSFALNDQLGIETDASNWPEAFRLLQKALEKCQKEQKSSSSMNFPGSTRMPPTSSVHWNISGTTGHHTAATSN